MQLSAEPDDSKSGDWKRFSEFSDLRGTIFGSRDLSGQRLVGCLLNGVSFDGANVRGLELVGCFAASQGDPVTFNGVVGSPILVGSHLGAEEGLHVQGTWPEAIANAVWRLMTGDNSVRYGMVTQLGESDFRPVGAVLASFLRDEEWDVRAACLAALSRLRRRGFPRADHEIVRFALRRLGDENSLVAAAAIDFLQGVAAPQRLLAELLADAGPSRNDADALELFRIVVALIRAGDPWGAVQGAFNPLLHQAALESDEPVLRGEYMYLLGNLEVADAQLWLRGLHDADPGVRARTLAGVRLLPEPIPAAWVEPLLEDPVEDVQIEALFTLSRATGVDRAALQALANRAPSQRFRDYVQLFLADGNDG